MTRARRLTPAGVLRAKEHLAALRADLEMPLDVPDEILSDSRYAKVFNDAPMVSHHPLRTRHDAADLMVEIVDQMQEKPFDDMPFWSWMGMYFLPDILDIETRRSKISKADETFVVEGKSAAPSRNAYRHYLWTAWRLRERFGEDVQHLLDRDIMDIGDLFRLSTNSRRVFNATGIVPLIMQLYTRNGRTKRGHSRGVGSIRHLLRVLDQLELTHDIYGMPAEALAEILPPEFDRWKT